MIKQYWKNHPLKSILILAFVVRLIAVIFSTGYAMHDDHFLVIETSASWADGHDYNNWLPESQKAIGIETPKPHGHSLFYSGTHYIFFKLSNFIGLQNPKIQMFIIRLIHAFLSLLVVLVSYKITEKLSTKKSAKIVGLTIALGWAFPFYGVRNLVELVCVPFLLYGLWQIIKTDFKDQWKTFLIAGFLFGLAFSIRLQLAVFYLGFGLCLLFMKKWKGSIGLIIGFSVGAFLSQGLIDFFIWDKPFAELIEYITYNSGDAKYDYADSWQWYKYILVMTTFSFPILGFFWLFGNFYSFKKLYWIFIPLVGFTLFHTVYPNQQERFIFPMIPLFIIAGVIGWQQFKSKSKFWSSKTKLWSITTKTAWVLNSIVLIGITTYATKTAKVDSAYYFYENNITESIFVLQDDSFSDESWYKGQATLMPHFYAKNWNMRMSSTNTKKERLSWEKGAKNADYILLHSGKKLTERINYFKQYYPQITIIETYKASPIDRLLHYMNPNNKNEMVTILKTNQK